MKKISRFFSFFAIAMVNYTCQSPGNTITAPAVKLVTLEPGHFHAALVQKKMYEDIDSVVYVYAPTGPELQAHLGLIDQYNNRAEDPTHWREEVYTEPDYLTKMLSDKKGNVVVLAGNNNRKTDYILQAVSAGMNVLADKPMAIDKDDFDKLLEAFAITGKKKVLLYDIMTERSEITNVLQKEFSQIPAVFGTLQQGTEKDPAVIIENVHFFYKQVSGKPLIRPDWFFDPEQEGDAIQDVGTHLVDLVQWICFPGKTIDYKQDISLQSSRTWPTPLTLQQFSSITAKNSFPGFLEKYVSDSILQTHANGEIRYTLRGVHVKLSARWEYQAEEGGDTHYCLMNGTNAQLLIRQGKEEEFRPTLYIFPQGVNSTLQKDSSILQQAVATLSGKYPGISVETYKQGWKVVIPEKYKTGHEAHFAEVMERYLEYLKEGNMPEWEVPNMIAKYYTTTQAFVKAANK